ncbi:hypothetical protein DNJ95_12165 [Stutzerimonas kirkiae]|uniref:DUF4351 domain-containing protein n=1 Tax=Stutzerimonas kirkiae TaxID=2211392 RepID=A0A4Q9R3I4_9GAMM|nr:DUF4351 domain-containing protein [Stutzerimonas kirkiae]TBU93291.1 hypothetical protein DNJ96_14220 [Stutzerimonas kirkiae]TBV01425.1 hypothetical protein DNJ95_12165 [Stutzerimonas kirkiae]
MTRPPLRRNITRWIIGLIRRRASNGRIPPLSDLSEVSAMLTERTETWTERWVQEGMEKGQVVLLQRQLGKRFGPLPEWAVQRIEQAGVEQIGEWAEAIFDARSLEALLEQDDA